MAEPLDIRRSRARFTVRPRDGIESDFWRAYVAQTWEPQTTAVLDRFVEPDRWVIDVGAWIGPITLYAASVGARVRAFEPDPIACASLRDNLALNPSLADRVQLFEFGLGAANRDATLYTRGPAGRGASSVHAYVRGAKTVPATLRDGREALGDLTLRDVSLVKIDIEGGEYELVPALGAALRQHRPPLYLSAHPFKLDVHGGFMLGRKLWSSLRLVRALRGYRYVYRWDGAAWTRGLPRAPRTLIKRGLYALPEMLFTQVAL